MVFTFQKIYVYTFLKYFVVEVVKSAGVLILYLV